MHLSQPDQTNLIVTLPAGSRPFAETLTGRIFLAAGASVLVAVAAHITLPLPFTPVPLVLSDLAVLIVGLTLGPVAALSALMLYLLEGAAGLPVFSPAGPGGVTQLLGPTGGYLFSYPLVALTASLVARACVRIMPKFVAGLLAALGASAVLFSFGTVWLAAEMHLSLAHAYRLAVLPFLLLAAGKIVAAAGVFGASLQFGAERKRT
jgi:biotin transport system substrate-specific component